MDTPLHVHTDDGVVGYTLHVHTEYDRKSLQVQRTSGVKGMQLAYPHCLQRKGTHPHVHTAGGGKENTRTSTLLTVKRYILTTTLLVVKRDTPPISHTVDCRKDTTSLSHCWWWKEIHPRAHN